MKTEVSNTNPVTPEAVRKSKFVSSSYWGSVLWSFIRAVLVLGIAFIILYPLIVKISSSLMSERDLFDLTVKWVPRRLDLASVLRNYRDVYAEMNYLEAFRNSLFLAFAVSGLQLASCTFVGYGFARFKFPGSGLLFGAVVLTLLVPPQMIMVPLFLNFRFFDFFGLSPEAINLLGTYWPFVLTSATGMGLKNGLFIYIMRQFFKGMPRDLEEAAVVDGAGQLRTFFVIMLPGASPALLIVFLFSFVWQWNDLFLTSMFMRRSATLLPFMLERLASSFDSYQYSREYISVIMNTGMLMFIAPLLLLYGFLQRYFIESVERTGIVG